MRLSEIISFRKFNVELIYTIDVNKIGIIINYFKDIRTSLVVYQGVNYNPISAAK